MLKSTIDIPYSEGEVNHYNDITVKKIESYVNNELDIFIIYKYLYKKFIWFLLNKLSKGLPLFIITEEPDESTYYIIANPYNKYLVNNMNLLQKHADHRLHIMMLDKLAQIINKERLDNAETL